MFLTENPTIKDLLGHVYPELNINTRVPFNEFVYIHGANNDSSANDTLKINVIVCGQERLALMQPDHPVFNKYEVIGEDRPEVDIYDLSQIWEVQPASPAVLPTDCPIVEYMLCNDTLCYEVLNSTEEGNEWFSLSSNANDTFANSTLELYMTEPYPIKDLYLGARTNGDNIVTHPVVW